MQLMNAHMDEQGLIADLLCQRLLPALRAAAVTSSARAQPPRRLRLAKPETVARLGHAKLAEQ
jgi:hypothetical protein